MRRGKESWLYGIKEKIFQHFLKIVRLFQGRTTTMEFCNKGESLDSTPNTARKHGIYSHRAGWRSVGERLLRGDIRGTGGVRLNWPDKVPSRWLDITWRDGGGWGTWSDIKSNQISGVGNSGSFRVSVNNHHFPPKEFLSETLCSKLGKFCSLFMINQEVLFYFDIRIATSNNVVPKLSCAGKHFYALRMHFGWTPTHAFPVMWPQPRKADNGNPALAAKWLIFHSGAALKTAHLISRQFFLLQPHGLKVLHTCFNLLYTVPALANASQ